MCPEVSFLRFTSDECEDDKVLLDNGPFIYKKRTVQSSSEAESVKSLRLNCNDVAGELLQEFIWCEPRRGNESYEEGTIMTTASAWAVIVVSCLM